MDNYYASRYIPDPTRNIAWKELARHHKKFIPADATVLDLGAGYCDFINNVEAKRKIAVDLSPDFSAFAADGVETIQSSAWDYVGIASGTVDVVHASNLLEHLNDEELGKTMSEIKRVLKSDGKLILMQPNYFYTYRKYFDDPTHKKVFSHSAMQAFLISHEMEVMLMMPKFLPFSLRSRPGIIPLKPWMIRAYIASPWKPFAGQMLFVARKK